MLRTHAHGSFRRAAAVAAALALAAAATATAQTRSGQVQRGDSGVCCINNFRFTGPCQVTLGPGESCGDVLSYLNSLNSAGRGYCGNTIIRGGWTLGHCDGGGGGVYTSPGNVTPTEPTTAPVTRSMRPISPTSPGTVGGGGATFVTPADSSGAVQVSEPGLINL